MSRLLFVLRNRMGVSQCDVGDRLGWSQDVVLEFEYKESDGMKVEDVERYLNALVAREKEKKEGKEGKEGKKIKNWM